MACTAVGAKRCVAFKKVGEGVSVLFLPRCCIIMSPFIRSYNKVFALDFDNGVEAIACLPTALAGAPFLTTASEVATMEFVREVLDIPAPRVRLQPYYLLTVYIR